MDKATELCDQMEMSENMDELKRTFADAFKLTRGMKLQQNIQAIYAECKAKLEATNEQAV